MTTLTFPNIGYNGKNVGVLSLSPDKLHWADSKGRTIDIDASSITSSAWNMVGSKYGHWRVFASSDASFYRFDGLKADDFQKLESYSKDNYNFSVVEDEIASSGANYGTIDVQGKILKVTSAGSAKVALELPLANLNSCVLNKDDLELQFMEEDNGENRDDFNLEQITFHFPLGQEGEELHAPAANFHKRIEEMDIIKSHASAGDTIIEFTKEQGNFITPRGKYALQMGATSFIMKGAKYTFPIKYTTVNSFYLLNLPNGNFAFLIALEKPIRQGQQKYQNLVMDLPAVVDEIHLNLTEEQLTQYNALQTTMEDELQNLVAKVFKCLSGKSVFVPKKFQTASEQFSIKCICKTSNGFLYPLQKSFVFIYKPALLIMFEDIKFIEYKNYNKNAKATSRYFEVRIVIKDQKHGSYEFKEYLFQNIDRIEFPFLNEYIESKGIATQYEETTSGGGKAEEYEEDDDEKYEKGSDENSEEEDDDYNGPSDDDDDDDDSGVSESEEDEEEGNKKSKKRGSDGAKKGGESDKKRSKK